MIKNFFIGFIRIHILYHADKAPIYGLEILEEVRRHGYNISPGTMYPTLHKLEAQRYLKTEKRVVKGKVRKYYTITREGRKALNEARAKIKELMDEVVEER